MSARSVRRQRINLAVNLTLILLAVAFVLTIVVQGTRLAAHECHAKGGRFYVGAGCSYPPGVKS